MEHLLRLGIGAVVAAAVIMALWVVGSLALSKPLEGSDHFLAVLFGIIAVLVVVMIGLIAYAIGYVFI